MEFLDHVWARQEEYGVKEAFLFRKYYNGREFMPVNYGIDTAIRPAAQPSTVNAASEAGRKKKKTKKKGKKGEPAQNDDRPLQNLIQFDGAQTPNIVPAGTPTLYDDLSMAQVYTCTSIDGGNQPVSHAVCIDPQLLADTDTSCGPNIIAHPPNITNPTMLVNDQQMQILRRYNEYSSIIPINGPNDGPPRYCVPAAAQDILDTSQNANDLEAPAQSTRTLRSHKAIQPAPSHSQVKSHKTRSMNADALAIQEAKEIIKAKATRGKGRMRRR